MTAGSCASSVGIDSLLSSMAAPESKLPRNRITKLIERLRRGGSHVNSTVRRVYETLALLSGSTFGDGQELASLKLEREP